MEDRVTFYVSGTCFRVSQGTCDKLRALSTSSSKIIEDALQKGSKRELFLDRDPASFAALIHYCHNGELHLPPIICPHVFKGEMAAWGVKISCLSNCCYNTMVSVLDDKRMVQEMEQNIRKMDGHPAVSPVVTLSAWQTVRIRAWNVLERPFYSRLSKLYTALFLVFLFASLFSMMASTHDAFKRALDQDEWQDALGEHYDDFSAFLHSKYGWPGGKHKSHLPPPMPPHNRTKRDTRVMEVGHDTKIVEMGQGHDLDRNAVFRNQTQYKVVSDSDKIFASDSQVTETDHELKLSEESGSENGGKLFLRKKRAAPPPPPTPSPTDSTTSYNENATESDVTGSDFTNYVSTVGSLGSNDTSDNSSEDYSYDFESSLQKYRARMFFLDYIDYACLAFFTLDCLLRLVFCPRLSQFFKSVLNLADLVSLLAMYSTLLVNKLLPEERYTMSTLDLIDCIQIFRFLRFFRLLRDVIGFKVLVYSVRASLYELLLLVMFLSAAVLLFSTLAFWCDRTTMKSIPDAFWWAIVTMTTVGYGDMAPCTFLGKLVGSMCALCGVVLIAITIPVLVNNFLLFYGYSKVITARQREQHKQVQNQWNGAVDKACKTRPNMLFNVNTVHVQPAGQDQGQGDRDKVKDARKDTGQDALH